jgi:hypothetical protein
VRKSCGIAGRSARLIDTIEISPDAIALSRAGRARLRSEALAENASVAYRVNFIAHGVFLSIGSSDN